ncbi:MAG: hypothetical protein V6Z89_11055 [Desulfobacter sp.]
MLIRMVVIFDSNYDYQLWDDADILGIIHIPKVLKKSTPNEKSVYQRIANTIRAINKHWPSSGQNLAALWGTLKKSAESFTRPTLLHL